MTNATTPSAATASIASSTRHQHARAAQLSRQPLCERHLAKGRVVAATVVHHRTAHNGDRELFFDPANLESICKPCRTASLSSKSASATPPKWMHHQGYRTTQTILSIDSDGHERQRLPL